jgi:hypothetical protein
MKKLFALMFLFTTAFAANQATLTLQGTISEVVEIAFDSVGGAIDKTVTLDLTATQTNTTIASVFEKSNSATGYDITVSSANAGKLVNSAAVAGITGEVPYTLEYDGVADVLNNPVPSRVNTTAGKESIVRISYTGVPATDLAAGTFNDVVTFTISAK